MPVTYYAYPSALTSKNKIHCNLTLKITLQNSNFIDSIERMYDLELIILTHRHKLSLSLSIVITGACRRSPERHWSSWIWSLQNNNQKIVGDGFADVVGENRLGMFNYLGA